MQVTAGLAELKAKRTAAEHEFMRYAIERGLGEPDALVMITEARSLPQQNPQMNAIYKAHQAVLLKETAMKKDNSTP